MKELCAKYGAATIKAFIADWFDYSDRRMEQAIRRLPAREVKEDSDLGMLPVTVGVASLPREVAEAALRNGGARAVSGPAGRSFMKEERPIGPH